MGGLGRGAVLVLVLAQLLAAGASGKRVNVILLGATGNLAEKYLWQGLYNIDSSGLGSGDDLHVFPAATKDAAKSSPILERLLRDNITESSAAGSKAAFLAKVAPYSQLRAPEQYEALGAAIEASLDGEEEAGRLIYLSVPPKFFGGIAANVDKFVRPKSAGAWLRVIVEKPFGVDLASAKALAGVLYESLHKDEILLVDHYMGKAGMHGIRSFVQQNPLVRYAQGRKVARVEVGMLETDDCKGRTGFYDEVGVLRDTMQNHLMMMLALLGMDKSDGMGKSDGDEAGETGSDEGAARRAVFERLSAATLDRVVRLGQYASYHAHVDEDRAKWGEPKLEARTLTPTYAHVVLSIKDAASALHNVPLHFKSGKALSVRRSYVDVHFDDGGVLVLNLQGPSAQGVDLGAFLHATPPLPGFAAPEGWAVTSSEETGHLAVAPAGPFAYEVLLRAGLEGETEHFVLLDEVLESWRVWSPLLEDLDVSGAHTSLEAYEHGSAMHDAEAGAGADDEEEGAEAEEEEEEEEEEEKTEL